MDNALSDGKRFRKETVSAPPVNLETKRNSGFAGAEFAHDFNNFLSGILGSLEIIQQRLTEGRIQELHGHVDNATRCARQAAVLTGRLLRTAGRDASVPTDTGPIIRLVAESLRTTTATSIEIEVADCPGLWSTLIDPVGFENLLLNICMNSIDAMPEGGRLTIATKNAVLTQDAGTGRCALPGECAAVVISDTGTGMPPDIVAHAFDPLFTTKAPGHGTGLGLWRARKFVENAGGQIGIESAPGKGTSVFVYLPRYVASGGQCRTACSSGASAPVGSKLPVA